MAIWETGWGLDVILWFQSWRTPLVVSIATVFHYLGQIEFLILVLPIVYWCVDKRAGRRLGVVVALSAWLNDAIKWWAARPRPYFISEDVVNLVTEDSYGVPSGHTHGAATLGGFAAIEARRAWVTVAAVLYIVLMALSRMILGVHYPQDVLLGILVALAVLALYVWLEPPISRWLARQTLGTHVGLAAAVSAAMLLVHPILFGVTSPPWLPEPLPVYELYEGPLAIPALFFGMGTGIALEWRGVRFSARGPVLQRVVRFVVGLAGVAALQFGLAPALDLLAPDSLVLGAALYALIGLWVGAGAPWLFVRVGMAPREDIPARQP